MELLQSSCETARLLPRVVAPHATAAVAHAEAPGWKKREMVLHAGSIGGAAAPPFLIKSSASAVTYTTHVSQQSEKSR